MRLTQVKAHSVRGIPRDWPSLPVGERGLVLFGPNGVGKSSVVDAIEFAITRRSSLFPENRSGVSWDQAAPHIDGGTPEIILTLEQGSTDFDISLNANLGSLHPSATEWFKAASGASFVLRRYMLLKFVSARPKDRYLQLEPFLNLDLYMQVENALKQKYYSAQSVVANAETDVGRYQIAIRNIFGLAPTDKFIRTVLYEKLNLQLAALGLPLCADNAEIDKTQVNVAHEFGGKAKTERLNSLGHLKTHAQRLDIPATLIPLAESLLDGVVKLETESREKKHEVITDFLEQGKLIIESQELANCPLCEQPIVTADVLAQLNERIGADERVTAARNLVEMRKKSLSQSVKKQLEGLRTLILDWKTVVAKPLHKGYEDICSMLDALDEALNGREVSSSQLAESIGKIRDGIGSHNEIVEILDNLIQAEGGGDRRVKLTSAASMIEWLVNDQSKYEAAKTKLKGFRRQESLFFKFQNHAENARKVTVQTIFSNVAKIANDLYNRMHPDEAIGRSELTVRSAVEGSAILAARFHGASEPPLLHYSESHLDTLGLAYFLAIRKYEAVNEPRFKMLVLDDVMHSVDADHRTRIATILRNEFNDHQIITTTHDWHFYEALRAALGSSKFIYLSISDWDIKCGPYLSDPSTDLDTIMSEDLRRSRSQNDLSAACGRFMEWLLKELTENLGVAVPARFRRKHDIGNLWPPFCNKAKKQKGFIAMHPTLVDDIDTNVWVRNACGAHHNETASAVTPKEVRTLAEALARLYKATHCEKACGRFISKQLNGDWRCDCGALNFSAKL